MAAHVLAWAAGVFLAFTVDHSSGETVGEVNVRWAIGLLVVLTPVVLTGIALGAALLVDSERSIRVGSVRTMLLWSTAIVLLALCFRFGLTFFVLYLPAALALFVAAIADSTVTRGEPRTGP